MRGLYKEEQVEAPAKTGDSCWEGLGYRQEPCIFREKALGREIYLGGHSGTDWEDRLGVESRTLFWD